MILFILLGMLTLDGRAEIGNFQVNKIIVFVMEYSNEIEHCTYII